MACMVESYNPRLGSSGTIPDDEALRAKLSAAADPDTLFVSPQALHSLSQDLCSSTYPLQSQASTVLTTAASPATRAEPSSCKPTGDVRQLGRPTPELAAHVHRSMREREGALLPMQLASPQLHNRCCIVDFFHTVCENLHLSRNTRFLAMLLVDHFMDRHIVMDYRLKLVALTCLLVAAKFEEHEDHTVCMEQLQIMAQCGEHPDIYTKDEFLMMELYLLKFFEWSVSHPTAVHFAEYFLSRDDEEMEEDLSGFTDSLPLAIQDKKERRAQLERLTSCFLEASLREASFLQLAHSLVAAAALCASRICLGLPTAWNHKLDILTGYSLDQISSTVDHMLKLFYNDSDM